MDIQLEKSKLIKRMEQINDESLIVAIKSLLDRAQSNFDTKLESSIDRGLKESKQELGKSHQEVMSKLREKYKN